MVITEKDISNAGEEKSAGKKAFDIWKKLWILGAIISVPIFILITIIAIFFE